MLTFCDRMEALIERFEHEADSASLHKTVAEVHKNDLQAEYELGRREAFRYAAELVRREMSGK